MKDVRLLGFGTFGTCCVRCVSPATRAREKICPWRLRPCPSSSRVRRSGRPWAAEPHDPPMKAETGQRQTASDSMLNPRACNTITGAFAGSSSRHREYKQRADLGSLSALGPRRRDRTGRNTTVACGLHFVIETKRARPPWVLPEKDYLLT